PPAGVPPPARAAPAPAPDPGPAAPPQPHPGRSLRAFDRHLRPLTIILWSIARTTGPPALRVVTDT
ncbi:hypothetical protein, partial [Streptomyces sp. NPDC059744]|uniref:hypothetical protein n=1 Tax=Streptomyces sp. NPDC059744 TaxID=3346929 RepID=UPI00365BCFAE